MAVALDKIDRAIIRYLTEDGRMSAAEIGRRISDVSARAVQYRIERLVEQNVIHVCAIVNPGTIGLEARADVVIDVDPGHVHEVAERLVDFDEVSYAVCYFGDYDVGITVYARDNAHLYTLLTGSVASIPGVRHTTVTFVPLVLKDLHHWRIPDGEDAGERPQSFPSLSGHPPVYRIRRLDQQITNLLIGDGRMAAAEVARRVDGVPATLVRERIDCLIDKGVFRVRALVNPEAVGFPVRADVYMEVEAEHVVQVAQELAQMVQVSYVACAMGGPDISVQVYARDYKEVYRFVTDVVHNLPGVTDTRTTLVAELVKRFYDWRVPDSVIE